MRSDRVRVSVLMPVYNEEVYLEKAIKSVLNQSFKDYEIIIIDDASNDNTNKIARKFSDAHDNIRLLAHKKNKLRSGALNSGLAVAKGEYICFLDGDDLYVGEKLKDQVMFLDSNPDIDLVYSGMERFYSDGRKESIALLGSNYNLRDLMKKNQKDIYRFINS